MRASGSAIANETAQDPLRPGGGGGVVADMLDHDSEEALKATDVWMPKIVIIPIGGVVECERHAATFV